jgi:hypothetical protein
MVHRRGIGATAAAAVVFSVVLISAIAIRAASESRASLYSEADFEDYLSDGSLALTGASAANVLLAVQSFLSGSDLDCASAHSAVGAEIATLSDYQSTGYLNESASALMVPGLGIADNLSSLAPFNGSLAGVLDIEIRTSASGGSAPAGVSFQKVETHFVHLPFRLDAAAAECVRDVEAITSAVSSFAMENCTASAVASFMDPLGSELSSASAAEGFDFGLQYTLMSGTQCTISFQVSITQTDIQGLNGPFSVALQDSAVATFPEQGDVGGASSL